MYVVRIRCNILDEALYSAFSNPVLPLEVPHLLDPRSAFAFSWSHQINYASSSSDWQYT